MRWWDKEWLWKRKHRRCVGKTREYWLRCKNGRGNQCCGKTVHDVVGCDWEWYENCKCACVDNMGRLCQVEVLNAVWPNQHSVERCDTEEEGEDCRATIMPQSYNQNDTIILKSYHFLLSSKFKNKQKKNAFFSFYRYLSTIFSVIICDSSISEFRLAEMKLIDCNIREN